MLKLILEISPPLCIHGTDYIIGKILPNPAGGTDVGHVSVRCDICGEQALSPLEGRIVVRQIRDRSLSQK